MRNKPAMNCELPAVERVQQREAEWTGLMRHANAGDAAAYERLLKALAPALRAAARRGLARAAHRAREPVQERDPVRIVHSRRKATR